MGEQAKILNSKIVSAMQLKKLV